MTSGGVFVFLCVCGEGGGWRERLGRIKRVRRRDFFFFFLGGGGWLVLKIK